MDEYENISKFHKLINPQKKFNLLLKKLTGITDEMLYDKPLFSDFAKEIDNFTKNSIFIAHNVNFDYRVLKEEFKRSGLNFKRKSLCTIELSKSVFPHEKSYSLGKLVSSLGIEIKNRHRADGDAMATLKLLKKYVKTLIKNS